MRVVTLLSVAAFVVAGTTARNYEDRIDERPAVAPLSSHDVPIAALSRGDSVVIAVGLRPLKENVLPTGSRELRIWIGGAITIPEDFYRVRIDGERVSGQLILYWDRKGRYEDSSEVSQGAMMRYSLDGTCEKIGTVGNIDACVARFTKSPDWKLFLNRIEAESVWTLRDQSEMPRDSIMVMDGYAISVEAREGASYRRYFYANPSSHANEGAKHAAAIAGAVDVIWPLVAPSRQRKIYRGRYTRAEERYELAICHDTTRWELTGDLWPLSPMRRDGTPDSTSDTIRVAYVEVRGEKAFPGLAKQWRSPYPEVIQVDSVMAVRPWREEECR